MAKGVLVIEFDVVDERSFPELLERVRDDVKDLPHVQVHMGIRHIAEAVISIFEPRGE